MATSNLLAPDLPFCGPQLKPAGSNTYSRILDEPSNGPAFGVRNPSAQLTRQPAPDRSSSVPFTYLSTGHLSPIPAQSTVSSPTLPILLQPPTQLNQCHREKTCSTDAHSLIHRLNQKWQFMEPAAVRACWLAGWLGECSSDRQPMQTPRNPLNMT